MPGWPILCAFCKGWAMPNLAHVGFRLVCHRADSARSQGKEKPKGSAVRNAHPVQRTQRMGHPPATVESKKLYRLQ